MSKINWLEFGELIKNKRKSKGISQVALSKELGVSQPVISLAERGSPIGFNEDRLDTLKKYLEISDDEIPSAEKAKPAGGRKKIFISYSHRDREYFDRLSVHLRPLEKKDFVETWSAEGSPQNYLIYQSLSALTDFQSHSLAHVRICRIAANICSPVIEKRASRQSRWPT